MPRIEVIQADITSLQVDAIVNAANKSLLGGAGVDGAIHRAAGPQLLAACRALPERAPGVRCPTSDACITPGFALPARFVIHTVGPVWHDGTRREDELLARCYRQCTQIAHQHGLSSLAFPAISCGVFGFPVDRAADIAVRTLRNSLGRTQLNVLLCAFNPPVLAALRDALQYPRMN